MRVQPATRGRVFRREIGQYVVIFILSKVMHTRDKAQLSSTTPRGTTTMQVMLRLLGAVPPKQLARRAVLEW